MLKKIATALLCTAAPVALIAEPVELRSSDGFISVVGEVVGFNGVMLSVETSVGVVSVPISEVGCYGNACLSLLAENDYGLTADNFTEVVVGGGAQTAVATPPAQPTVVDEPAATPVGPREDNMIVSFEDPEFEGLFQALAQAYAAAGNVTSDLDLATPDEFTLSNPASSATATLSTALGQDDGDIELVIAPLTGTASREHQSPADWSLTGPINYQLLGLKAFAVVIAPDVGIPSLSLDDLAGIYASEITNWSEVGGPDQRILPLQAPVNTTIRNELIRLVMDPADKEIANNVLTMADEAAITASINQFPGSISLVTLDGAMDSNVLPVSGECGQVVTPEPFNLISGDYPLIRPVMARFDTSPNTSLMTEFFDFASTSAAQAPIAAQGFINRQPTTQNPLTNDNRLLAILQSELTDVQRPAAAQMFEVLFDADRLSPTMIGGAVSGPEGGWNRSMFRGLAETLADDAYAGREVFFVGLAESDSGEQVAIDASAQAAAEMQAAFGAFASDVIFANDLQLSAYGFGNVAQATCYRAQVASDTRSRVEIWVR